MRIHSPTILQLTFRELTEFPLTPIEGQLAFVNDHLYIYRINGTVNEWVKMMNEPITDYISDQGDTIYGDIIPDQSGTVNLGASDKAYNYIWLKNLNLMELAIRF